MSYSALISHKRGPFAYLVQLLLKGERVMDGLRPHDVHAVQRFANLFAEGLCLSSKNNGYGGAA